MYQRDFILRIIEQIARMIAVFLGLLKEDKFDVAYDMLRDKSELIIGEDYSRYLEMSFIEFKDSLKGKTLSANYWDILGRYFLIAGELCLGLKKDEEAIHNLNFAQACFDEAANNYNTYSFDRQIDIDKLNQLKRRVGMF